MGQPSDQVTLPLQGEGKGWGHSELQEIRRHCKCRLEIHYFCLMDIKVFKFGGASVNSVASVTNIPSILKRYPGHILVVISAMDKTTNALEELLRHYLTRDSVSMIDAYNRILDFHETILQGLFPDRNHPVYRETAALFDYLKGYLRKGHLDEKQDKGYDFEYDQVVSFGELFSATIVHHYLVTSGLDCKLFDARKLVKTDHSYRDARVDWPSSVKLIRRSFKKYFSDTNHGRKIAMIQGFIGSDKEGNTTTLGREGSDYTAAIMAYAMKLREVTIWKDVPGIMNADPKWFRQAQKIDTLSYREAIELAYFGASVIHPKTIKPLENAEIILRVKSFLDPEKMGTTVKNIKKWKVPFPIYIRKQNQVLISLSPRDFSFIMEKNLSQIFDILAKCRVRVNVMQNSAISFSICVDDHPFVIPELLKELGKNYEALYNSGLDLYTIRHYDQSAINRITRGRKVLLEQKSRNTVHLILK